MATTLVPLQGQLDGFMNEVKKQAPAEVLATVDQAHIDLAARGVLDHALKVGDRIPAFRLPDATGSEVASQDLLAKGPIVISFYRGSWCPFCNLELKALQNALPEFERYGASLVAISPEKPEGSKELIEKHSLNFEVLSDFGNNVAKQFGIVWGLEGKYRDVASGAFGVDLPKSNGDASWQLPVPATYVVDKGGTIRFAFVDIEFRRRAEPEAILEVLKAL